MCELIWHCSRGHRPPSGCRVIVLARIGRDTRSRIRYSAWVLQPDSAVFKPAAERRGICCAGNFIIDHVKTVNTWPAEETLSDILAEDLGTGGSPYNVCIDLARFGVDFPLWALGLVGDDEDGRRILAHTRQAEVDVQFLRTVLNATTAYTDVINVANTGRRTFFHHRGANALLSAEHFPIEAMDCRILSLGYLMLLDALDAHDQEYGTVAARVLAACRAAGIRTAVDLVSEDSDRYARIVGPSLAHTDYLIINEIEAERASGRVVRNDGELDHDAVEAAAHTLLDHGVSELVVIHAPEIAVAVERGGNTTRQPSLALPEGFIAGGAGAGDAFFAGMLLGLHEGWELNRSLMFAHGAAASSLRHPTCTEGIGAADAIKSLTEKLGWRQV